MTTKSTLSRVILCAALLAAGALPQTAYADRGESGESVSGTTNLKVVMPEYIVLHYYSDIQLSFTAASSAESDGTLSPLTASWTTATEGGEVFDANITSAAEAGDATRAITLKNVWSIAGLSPSGEARVSITGTDLEKDDSSSKIDTEDWKVAVGSNAGKSIETDLRGISGKQTKGDVKMTLNFANTTESGEHDGSFTITAITI
ncbi:hypothetical protein [Pelodictyon luteolum]|uniref:WxL domain-containing protein n=1 Tax=Chlorobium luteolum (strain DSM 273 / BCRC 81028 / 2530) TaxID=319225 RepID=Q3B3W9_CHLL3|nr:hypothetical protein [Pelodictyon luteolum]ABB23962.1 hypothetical protein Plut_1100 [Pelodictyon luteolum DSM 273]